MSDRNKNKKNSPSEFLRYKRGEMTGEERNSFEREIQKDPFTEEASEGFELLSPDQTLTDFKKLHKRLGSRTSGKNGFVYYRIAASVAVLMIISSIFIFIDRKESEEQFIVSDNKLTTFEIIMAEPYTLPLSENIKKAERSIISDKKEAESVSALATGETIRSEAIISDNRIIAKDERIDSIPKTGDRQTEVYLAEERQATPVAMAKLKTAPLLQVKGKVISTDDNMPVPGVSINIKGTNKGVITDASGDFSIALPDMEKRTLVATFIGMESKEFEAKADTRIQVELDPAVSALSEVVVVGYGVRKDEDTFSGYVAPQPVNGEPAFNKYIKENIRRPDTITSGQRVVVVLAFRVRTDGKIDSLEVVRSPCKLFSDEAVRLIKEGPRWKAAEENGKVKEDEVRVRIVFR